MFYVDTSCLIQYPSASRGAGCELEVPALASVSLRPPRVDGVEAAGEGGNVLLLSGGR